MKVKFANRIYEVLFTKELAGLTMYAVEDEPNHIDWLINVEVVDAEKKELKKIEQKSAWSEKDETTKNNISHIIRQYDKISKRENQPCWYVGDCLLWMQSIKDRVQPQSKQEWSEEDERMFNSALWHIKNSCGNQGKNSGEFEVYNWAKSIKDRVQPQPKQEWNEEDENMLTDTEYLMRVVKMENRSDNEYQRADNCINWLKSLRPQNRWKPSDEQIVALKHAFNDGSIDFADMKILGTLYEQLKALHRYEQDT